MQERASQAAWEAELPRIDRELDRLVDAICDGVPASKVKDRMIYLEAQDEASKAEAFEVLRSLIHRVTLVPEDGQLTIELRAAPAMHAR